MQRLVHPSIARAVAALVLTAVVPAITMAQKPFTFGVGGGAAVGSRGTPDDGSYAHALAFLELRAPVLPIGLRGDAMLSKNPTGNGAFSVSASGVYALPIPVVTPYAIGGWGLYGVGTSAKVGGWSLGAGLRVKVPTTAGVFAEMRRHQRFKRDVFTVGIAL